MVTRSHVLCKLFSKGKLSVSTFLIKKVRITDIHTPISVIFCLRSLSIDAKSLVMSSNTIAHAKSTVGMLYMQWYSEIAANVTPCWCHKPPQYAHSMLHY